MCESEKRYSCSSEDDLKSGGSERGKTNSTTSRSRLALVAGSQMSLIFLLAIVFGVRSAPPKTAPYKGYTGIRLRNDSMPMIYYNEQAFAVMELGRKRELYNCEIIEAYESDVQKELRKNLTTIGSVYKIGFTSMLDLMNRCNELPTPSWTVSHPAPNTGHPNVEASLLNGVFPAASSSSKKALLNQLLKDVCALYSSEVPTLPIYILSVFIGTRWCGNGDIASSYYDLGAERSDKCCRKHDLCPVKVRNSSSKYGITNEGFSMSHCECDYEFYKCLKKTNSTVGNAMEYLYFNFLKSMCLDGSVTKGFKIVNSSSYTAAKVNKKGLT